MEVHAHTHTPRKKWTHYLWEFLMLFLAVFCGFLAENQREHMVENQREKKYMKSLLSDLAADTLFINNNRIYAETTIQKHDSFQKNLYSDSILEKADAVYLQYAGYFRLLTPKFNDQTITQLRNSGNLRLIRNNEIASKLSEYWNKIQETMKLAERVEQRFDVSAQIASRIFNRKYILRQEDTITGNPIYTIYDNPKFMIWDKNELVAFANMVNRIESSIKVGYVPLLDSQKKQAEELIELIKKEYHLK